MISVTELTKLILSNRIETKTISVSFQESVGYVLAEDIFADRDFPPFDRVAMDGIAINYDWFESGKRAFNIEHVIAAGDEQYTVKDSSSCVEIMTGASMPKGVDTVIRYEDVIVKNGVATVTVDVIRSKQNIHFRAMDNDKGALLMPKDHTIKSVDLSILATVGKSIVKVYKPVKTAIISSGDELVAVDQDPLPHQIRKSNVYVIKSMIAPYQIDADLFHLKDDVDDIKSKLTDILKSYDALILIGGVSKGKFDYIPEVLTEMGVEKLAYRVAQRPGKPFWFGRIEDKMIFALPGNPVSSMVCTRRYFIPWLRQQLQLSALDSISAELSNTYNFKPSLTRFLEVGIIYKEGKVYAEPKAGNGSGDFTTLNRSHGFMELPADQDHFEKGTRYPVFLF